MKIESTLYHYGSGFATEGTQQSSSRKPLGYSQFSGTLCQQSGQWRTEWQTATHVVSVEKGHIMPYHASHPVQWQLVDYAISEGLNLTDASA